MIIKKIRRKSPTRSAGNAEFTYLRHLSRYIVRADIDDLQELARLSDDRYLRDLARYAIADAREGAALATGGLNLKGATLPEWQAELAALLHRCPDAAGVIDHWIFSWPAGETPTLPEAERVIQIFMRCQGIERCKGVWGFHIDTDNPHLHLATMRIDPQSGARITAGDGWDIDAAHRAKAVIEAEYAHWKPEPGSRYLVRDGLLIEGSSSRVLGAAEDPTSWLRHRARSNSPAGIPKRDHPAIDPESLAYEAATGFMSRKRVAIEIAVPIVLQPIDLENGIELARIAQMIGKDIVYSGWVRPTSMWLANRGSLMVNRHLAEIDNVAAAMAEIENIADNDIAEVKQSEALFGSVAEASAPLDALLGLVQADALMGVFDDTPSRVRETSSQLRASRASVIEQERDKETARKGATTETVAAKVATATQRIDKAIARAGEIEARFERAQAFKMVLEGSFGDPAAIATGAVTIANAMDRADASAGVADQTSLLPDVAPDRQRRLLADALVGNARGLAREHHFFNWEIAFPGVWRDLASPGRTGGFDAVIGNPPYVRHEMIGAIKPALERAYMSFSSTADLYVYFYEQGLKLLRPGGRMAYVVTNKWLKAGYAERLRKLFAEDAWVEFMADFGHARRFFPDADVFPCVIAVRKPDGSAVPETFDLAVIPRDDLPRNGLAEAVQAASYVARRDGLTAEPWTLEPPDVAALIAKIKANGTPVSDYAGVKPYRGVLTGFNEAFLIDTATKERLIAEDGRAADIIRPYLRGQDIGRWKPDWAGLWMIVMKSSSDFAWPWANATTEEAAEAIFAASYPSLYRHLKSFESLTDAKTGKRKGLRHREDHGRFWWELRPCGYYDEFAKPKLCWQAIQFYPQYGMDRSGLFINNKAYVLATDDPWIAATLNSPAAWWLSWRHFPHMKDEALSNDAVKLVQMPVPRLLAADRSEMERSAECLEAAVMTIRSADRSLADWLHHEIGLSKIPAVLAQASRLDSDGFVAAVRGALPKRAGISPTRLAQLRAAFADTAEPARATRAAALGDERALSDIVNRAYGLTPDEVALMWRTAPPRMPLAAPTLGDPILADPAADLL